MPEQKNLSAARLLHAISLFGNNYVISRKRNEKKDKREREKCLVYQAYHRHQKMKLFLFSHSRSRFLRAFQMELLPRKRFSKRSRERKREREKEKKLIETKRTTNRNVYMDLNMNIIEIIFFFTAFVCDFFLSSWIIFLFL